MIIAFFPCTRFEDMIQTFFRGVAPQQKKMSDETKLQYAMYYHKQLAENYEIVTKLAIVVIKKNLRMIMENPYSTQHYLKNFWTIKPKVIDSNRKLLGDYYIKPTQFWFINCEPKHNMLDEPLYQVEHRTVNENRTKERSEIHPQYARNFIKRYIADYENGEWIV